MINLWTLWFGRETRYVFRLYLIQTCIVSLLILTLVLALDLAGRYDQITGADGQAGAAFATLSRYTLLRAEFNLPAILPIAVFVGIIWTELRLSMAHERAMIANTGRALSLSLIPALLTGLCVGAVQFTLLAEVRPQSVATMDAEGYRFYGLRFRGGTTEPIWLDVNGALLNTKIRFDQSGPVLLGASLFSFDGLGQVKRIAWLEQTRVNNGRLEPAGARAGWPDKEDITEIMHVDIDADWLNWVGVTPRFLPHPVLLRIAYAKTGVPGQNEYLAALHERRASVAMSVAIALLAAWLSLRWMSPRLSLRVPAIIASIAYCVHILMNILTTLGEFERLPPVIAAWTLPLALIVFCCSTVVVEEWKVRKRLATLIPPE